jgi:hypothetical protein
VNGRGLALRATIRFHRVMATHALVYYGWFDHGFRRLHATQDKYWKKDDDPDSHPDGRPVERPPERFTGIQFGFMQISGGHLFIKIDELVLRAPILFIGGRHGPTAPGPAWSELTDEVAARILADAIIANPEYRDLLATKVRGLEPTS